MRPNNQEDIVREKMGYQPETTTEKVMIPGIDKLHERSVDELAEAIAMVIKSRDNIVAFHYQLGQYMELTTAR